MSILIAESRYVINSKMVFYIVKNVVDIFWKKLDISSFILD